MMVDDGIVQVKPFLACHVSAHICRLQASKKCLISWADNLYERRTSLGSYLREISRKRQVRV